jgi:DNA repair exonuclease SbcCD ATPase subunit
MSGGVIWIKISTQVKKIKGLKDELGVEVFRWMPDGTVVSRPYRVWSGGEKRRIALAVDLGLSRLMALRAAKAYRFLGLDEIDRHLDERGREGLRMVLEELRTERDSVLCITHDQAFRASFDGEIRVTKQGGKSRLESVNNEHP